MRLSVSLLALCALQSPALAADIDVDSLVTAATVYPSGATVTRQAEFSAESGTNSIIIDDLPLDFDPASLRISGEGNAEFAIVSVNHRVDRLPPEDEKTSPQVQRLEDEIEAMEDQLEALDRDIRDQHALMSVADARLKFAHALISREPQKMVDDLEYQRATTATWAEAIGIVTAEVDKAMTARNLAATEVDRIEKQKEDIREELQKKQQALSATQMPRPPRSIATVEIDTDSALEGKLQISYRIDEAGWQPVYDLRLNQGETASLGIERHARVVQYSGEDWTDVALTLSTARPTQRMEAPELWEIQVRPAPKVTPMRPAASAGLQMQKRQPLEAQSEMLADAMVEEDVALAPAPEPVFVGQSRSAEIDTQGQTIIYKLPTKATVSGDGTVRQLSIDSHEMEVKMLARSTPELDSNAYLYASLTNSLGGPLLPGSASVFRDGTFVGETHVALTAAGEETMLPFGVLDGVTVKRRVLSREDGDFGIIGTTNRRTERYAIIAESVLSYAIPLTIFDRAPYSENEDFEVEVYARPAPSETSVEGKRGVRSWTFELGAGTKKKIEFSYEITWPGDQQIVVH
ncbi:mucoidy inhibitor MuiA family protein [Halovulum sp. GXIMD14793]